MREGMENRFAIIIETCIFDKFTGKGPLERLRKSLLKKALYFVMRNIADEISAYEDFYKSTEVKLNKIFEFDRFGAKFKFYLPYARIDTLQRLIGINRKFYEEDLLSHIKDTYLKPGMNILDCGANIGNHTVFFSKVAKAKKVFSFEGNPDTYETLVRNVELNELQDCVRLFQCVLGEEKGSAQIDNFDILNIGATTFKESSEGLPMIRIDDLDFGEKIDFIKMDVEGFEYHVLKGMENLMRRDKPILWIESFPNKYNDVEYLLTELGYNKCEEFVGSNYIFIPAK